MALATTVKAYNKYCDAGEDPDFKRAVTDDDKVGDSPYYSAKMAAYVLNTMGGILIDATGHVVDKNGQAIDGLYAAGEITGNFDGACRRHGDNFAQIYWYGYLIGKTIAEEM